MTTMIAEKTMVDRIPSYLEDQNQEEDTGPVRPDVSTYDVHIADHQIGGSVSGGRKLDQSDLGKMYRYEVIKSRSSKLQQLGEKCSEEGWDGEGAAAVDGETIAAAQMMATFFPMTGAQPEINATPFGEVSFDWNFPGCALLSVTVCPSGDIAFSGLLSQADLHDLSSEKIETVRGFTSSWFSMLKSVCKNA